MNKNEAPGEPIGTGKLFLDPHLPSKMPATMPNLLQIGAKALWIASLLEDPQRSVCLFVESRQQAEDYQSYLRFFGVQDSFYYPVPVLSPYEWSEHIRDDCVQRHWLRQQLLYETPPRCILMPFKGLSHMLMDNNTWQTATLLLKQGQEIPPRHLIQHLVQMGYTGTERVMEPGQFSRRGGRVDIYPVGEIHPARLEWLGDEVESIADFRLEMTEPPLARQQLRIPPACEWWIPQDIANIHDYSQKLENSASIKVALETFHYIPELRRIIPLLHPTASIMTSFRQDRLLIWPETVKQKFVQYAEQLESQYRDSKLPFKLHVSLPEFKDTMANFNECILTGHENQAKGTFLPPIEQNLDAIADKFKHWLENGYSISVVSSQPQRIFQILQERSCPTQHKALNPKAVNILRGDLPMGFAYSPTGLFCFTDRELFGQKREPVRVQRLAVDRERIRHVEQLKTGMLVVHEVHGIGKYQGLTQSDISGQQREYMKVAYAGEDVLLVPVEQLNRLQLYHGIGGTIRLNRMGGSDWEQIKSRVRKGLRDIAQELIQTEAERLQQIGFAFSPDSDWQQEMELAFPYEETPDQMKAIQETKQDMEKPVPMDRLVCGDVGFGKTEVALRAAFKAILSGKQVALLVPTTVLAQQHYQVFKERFSPYPIEVDLLSRYRTVKEAESIFERIRMGMLDIVISTHRLLSHKLNFHDLGLLIIDEEHRFGVSHKEKLKKIKANVDILTMSATPIPRTLHMALSGVRSLSLIETPPPNRLPIKTQALPYQKEAIRVAILNELERGGQVFFVHNRVSTIDEVARKLKHLVPQARLKVAHGQMPKRILEDTMLDFYNHVFDILVCTTIIESGLDIPNANTLIVDRVELLGLAQLHQLRGRIGRSDIQAYAYFFYQGNKVMTNEARERLNVLEAFSELGSGYHIALKDMEIRGIGNILGAQQHGHIVSVGFETYCQMLEENIQTLKGQSVDIRPRAVVVDLNLTAYIPESWIGNLDEKLAIYRNLARLDNLTYLDNLAKVCQNRYGDMPEPASTLWSVTRVRVLLAHINAERVVYDGGMLLVQGNLDANLWAIASLHQPRLKPWRYQSDRLSRPRTPRNEDNLKYLEDMLKVLLEAKEEYT